MARVHIAVKHKLYIFLFIILFSIFGVKHISFCWTGKCVSVSDGDTIGVMYFGKEEKIRLYGIDCPANGQDFGNRAKQFTASLVFGREVDISDKETDKYGRTVGFVYVKNKCVNEEIIKNGYAWVYRKYCNDEICDKWRRLEENARNQKSGLWERTDCIPPWEYRHNGFSRKQNIANNSLLLTPYHGNTKSHVFHSSSCKHYNCKNCTVNFKSREDALTAGYRPCRICKP